jgi:hypothetical protein
MSHLPDAKLAEVLAELLAEFEKSAEIAEHAPLVMTADECRTVAALIRELIAARALIDHALLNAFYAGDQTPVLGRIEAHKDRSIAALTQQLAAMRAERDAARAKWERLARRAAALLNAFYAGDQDKLGCEVVDLGIELTEGMPVDRSATPPPTTTASEDDNETLIEIAKDIAQSGVEFDEAIARDTWARLHDLFPRDPTTAPTRRNGSRSRAARSR